MQVVQGDVAHLETTYRDGGGNAIDVDDATLEIFNDLGGSVYGPVAATWDGLGQYSADWEVSDNETPGWYRAVWSGEYLSVPVTPGEEWFEVVIPGQAVTFSEVETLRMMAGDRIKVGETEGDKFFTDHELQVILNMANGDLNVAAAICWSAKASEYAELIDMNESGSDRKLSQMFKQASLRAEFFTEAAGSVEKAAQAGWRVVGRVICLDDSQSVTTGSPFDDGSMYVRTYPLKRFPAIMGGRYVPS